MGIKYTARSHSARPTSVLGLLDVTAFFLFHHEQKSQLDYGSLAWLLAVVMRIGNVLITSFRSHRRAHPCILWRSKLRNTYCTLCKGLLQNIAMKCKIECVNLLLGRFKAMPPVLPAGIAVCFAVKIAHT